ncbi:hypothetical_protein [Leishmania braziliensis MHOM/BR/75/M2904]|nr:hypothetical_protein [Leishmania braziliensis MHOM/BR/75/M2904]
MAFSTLPYITRDVATEPPTAIVIVPCGDQPPEMSSKDEAMFAVTEDCVEPTKGWINREGKPLLTVCFMHSFGKCVGRTNSNPATCFQIHIKANILNSLRKHYINPTRRFFARTVKALLSPELRQLLCMRANKELKVQYLEYRVTDVFPSTGLLQYEEAYRRWLFSADTNAEHAGAIAVLQCLQFSTTGSCSFSTDCPCIHADLKKAQARDPILARALRDISEVTQGLPTVSTRVPRSLQPGCLQSFSPVDGSYAMLADGAQPRNRMVSDSLRDFNTVPAFTLVCGEGESGGCHIQLQMHPHESNASSVRGHASGGHHLNRVSLFTQDEPASETISSKVMPNRTKHHNISSDGKNSSDLVRSSSEEVSGTNHHTGSSGSGRD